MDGLKKGADHPVSFWMRETLCLERAGGEWRMVHEHAWVPFSIWDTCVYGQH